MGTTEPPLIRGYLAALAARLPASMAAELGDGLTETYAFYRSRGLAPEEAAEAAVAEFGTAEEIVAGFADVNPARRAARRLLGIGPAVGACWVAALLTSHAGRSWTSPGPTWVVAAVFVLGPVGGVTAVAMAASLARIAVTARALHPALIR